MERKTLTLLKYHKNLHNSLHKIVHRALEKFSRLNSYENSPHFLAENFLFAFLKYFRCNHLNIRFYRMKPMRWVGWWEGKKLQCECLLPREIEITTSSLFIGEILLSLSATLKKLSLPSCGYRLITDTNEGNFYFL